MKKKVTTREENPFDHYNVIEMIGEGSSTRVYKVSSKKNSSFWGPFYSSRVFSDIFQLSENEEFMVKFLQINRKNVVRLHDSFFYNNEWHIIEEYCEGGSVENITKFLKRSLFENEMRVVVREVLKGILSFHEEKVIHNDIKGSNILLKRDGNVRLSDYGVKKTFYNSQKRRSGIGIPFWMSPEVIQDSEYDEKADIWSLGVTMIEIGEGKAPLSDIHPMRAIFIIPNKPSPKFKSPENWSDDCNDFLNKCLKKHPEERPSAKQLLRHPWILKCQKGIFILKRLVDELFREYTKFGGRLKYLEHQKEIEKKLSNRSDTDTSTSYTTSSTDSDTDTDVPIRISEKISRYYSDSDSDSSSSDDYESIPRNWKKKKIKKFEMNYDSDTDVLEKGYLQNKRIYYCDEKLSKRLEKSYQDMIEIEHNLIERKKEIEKRLLKFKIIRNDVEEISKNMKKGEKTKGIEKVLKKKNFYSIKSILKMILKRNQKHAKRITKL